MMTSGATAPPADSTSSQPSCAAVPPLERMMRCSMQCKMMICIIFVLWGVVRHWPRHPLALIDCLHKAPQAGVPLAARNGYRHHVVSSPLLSPLLRSSHILDHSRSNMLSIYFIISTRCHSLYRSTFITHCLFHSHRLCILYYIIGSYLLDDIDRTLTCPQQ